MRQNYQELLAAGIRYFSTWRSPSKPAASPTIPSGNTRDWSKERIVETIQRLEKEGVDLSFRSMMLSKNMLPWSTPPSGPITLAPGRTR